MDMERKPQRSILYRIGIMLLILAILGWVLAVIVPFTPFSAAVKAAVVSGILIIAEILFWIGALFVGKEVVAKFKSYLNPKNWRKKHKEQKHEE